MPNAAQLRHCGLAQGETSARDKDTLESTEEGVRDSVGEGDVEIAVRVTGVQPAVLHSIALSHRPDH